MICPHRREKTQFYCAVLVSSGAGAWGEGVPLGEGAAEGVATIVAMGGGSE